MARGPSQNAGGGGDDPLIGGGTNVSRPIQCQTPEDPMSADTYRAILASLQRYNSSSYLHSGEDEFTEEELKVRQDMAKNKAVWCGEFRRDLWYYLINMNPILASCYSHPLHPISRNERFLVYGLSFVFVTNVAAATSLASACQVCHYAGCHSGVRLNCSSLDVNWTRTNQTRFELDVMPHFCCASDDFGALWFLHHFGDFGGTMYNFLANVIFSLTCFQLMMCPCVQSRSKRARHIGEIVGVVLFVLIAIVTFGSMNGLYQRVYEIKHYFPRAAWYFISSKFISWAGASVFNVAVFCLLFHIQRPKTEGSRWKWMDPPATYGVADPRNGLLKGLSPRFHVLALEYQQWRRSSEEDVESSS